MARVLSQPEPATGYIVSKSWCKQALRWLELQHEQKKTDKKSSHKKLSKKKQRLRNRRLSDASPPWPDANSDLLCPHNALAVSSNSKSTRARRKVVDKQAWRILRKLYPQTTTLQSECVQCLAEAEIGRKTAQDLALQEKLQRKQPLSDPVVRRFYTRSKGVPEQALRVRSSEEEQGDRKLPARPECPLQPGRYYILPRAWCYGWRRYIRTGEGGTAKSYPAPDAASMLCDAHRMVLLPPHLESYLYGEQSQLLMSSSTNDLAIEASPRRTVPGLAEPQPLDTESLRAIMAAGLSHLEVRRQVSAMRGMEVQQQQQEQQQQNIAQSPGSSSSSLTKNERLDRENHAVVEIVTQAEFTALEGLWKHSFFGVSFTVNEDNSMDMDMPVCRACDATGRDVLCRVRNRSLKKKASLVSDASNLKQAPKPSFEY